MYDYARIVDIPDKARDPIAKMTLQRFNEAVDWQSKEDVGGKSLKEVLGECYEQANGILSCKDKEIADEIGVDSYVNITAMKCDIVTSYLKDALLPNDSLPFTLKPTPIPNLSDDGRLEALEMLKEQVFGLNFDGDLRTLANQIAQTVFSNEQRIASERATAMEQLIFDQCSEGGLNNALTAFARDLTRYPFAVLQGPIPIRRPRMVWNGDTVSIKYETFYGFNHVSPWDFWYAPDCTNTQDGTGVFIRQRWTRQNLIAASKMRSYIQENVLDVLEEISKNKSYLFNWLSSNPEQPDDRLSLWANCSATVDVLVHYGTFPGRMLSEYGVRNLDDSEWYNATISVIQDKVIQVAIAPNPQLDIRPVFTASFYPGTGRIPGFGIAQRVRDVERCFLAALRLLMSNAANASGPIVELDYKRVAEYMTDEDISRVYPNSVYPVTSEITGANTPALRFNSIPSNMAGYMQLLNYFMDLADKVTNVPAALHGIAQGTGVNRTFRGAAMLQGNAIKAITDAVKNVDEGVFVPLGQLIYYYNMKFEDDPRIMGDCQIVAQGAAGLEQREIERQASQELLQLVAAGQAQLQNWPRGELILDFALETLLGRSGVPQDILTLARGGGIPGSTNQLPGGDLSTPAALPSPEAAFQVGAA